MLHRILSRVRQSALSLALCAGLFAAAAAQAFAAPGEGPKWQGWSEGIFRAAKDQKRLVLLDLEARWCHWCHVMDEETYANPEVAALLKSDFIPVRVDQDARPDLSARYRDYGWPATIIFNSKGEELAKLSGFQSPEELIAVLKASLKDPTPRSRPGTALLKGELVSSLPDTLRDELVRRHAAAIDESLGGLKTAHRYLDPDSVEYAITRAQAGDPRNKAWAEKTLAANVQLIDPVWGGAYQYSTRGSWDHPHFEKIMPSQMANIRLYAYAFRVFGKKDLLEQAESVARYVNSFLRGENGAYYTSQDADVVPGRHADGYYALDDAGRRAQGIPAVDKHQYARDNGMAILAMAELYSTTGDPRHLQAATRAAEWLVTSRRGSNGSFRHGDDTGEPLCLADSLWAGRGLLALYAVTGDRAWLARARETLGAIEQLFSNPDGAGFLSSAPGPQSPLRPAIRLEENIALARFANELFRYTGDASFQGAARRALSFAAQREAALGSISEPGVLLAGEELATDPPHFTVVGGKGDAAAQELFADTLKVPAVYARREWWDRQEGPMPNPDVQYPQLPKAAAFVCANKRCSLPIFGGEELTSRIAQVFAAK